MDHSRGLCLQKTNNWNQVNFLSVISLKFRLTSTFFN